ncbi:hypothetical protein ACFWW0_01720, partial [Streptomyces violascens]
AAAARLGGTPSSPPGAPPPRAPGARARASGHEPGEWTAAELAAGRLRFACADPDAPANWPRVLTVRRANLIGSSAKGNEFFLRHLLGASDNASAEEAAPDERPSEVVWHEEAPRGKLDLLLARASRCARRGRVPGRARCDKGTPAVSTCTRSSTRNAT